LEVYGLRARRTAPAAATTLFEGEIVGREEEVAQGLAFCRPLSEGRFAGVFYVYGDAGIGKSRLLFEIAERMTPAAQYLVLQADTILRKSFNPFSFFFRAYFGQTDAAAAAENRAAFDDRWRSFIAEVTAAAEKERAAPIIEELARTKAVIAALAGLRWPDSFYEQLDAKGRFENTLFAVKAFIKALSLCRPVVIILEDIQSLDADSHEALALLCRGVENFPFVILSSARIADDGSKPALAVDDVPTAAVTLEELPAAAVPPLVAARLGGPGDDDLVQFVAERAGRNPFFIEQLCLYLRENELLLARGDEFILSGEDRSVPESIRAVLLARLDRLSQEVKELVQAAAVLGREFDVVVLSYMLRGKDIRPYLAEGERAAVWTPLSEIFYIFKHALLRDAAYEMQLGARLRDLHKAAAAAMEKLYEGDETRYADVAYHYERAEVPAKAEEYLRKAADYAKNEYKNEEALALYERLLTYLGADEARFEVGDKRAEILMLVGRWDEAERLSRDNLKLARALARPTFIATAEARWGTLLRQKGSLDDALPLLENAYRTFDELGDLQPLARTLNGIGIVHYIKGDYDEAVRRWREQIHISEKGDDQVGVIDALQCLGNAAVGREAYDEALAYYERAYNIAGEIGNRRAAARAAIGIGNVYQAVGAVGRAAEYHKKSSEIASEIGDRQIAAVALGSMGVTYAYEGQFEKGNACFERVLEISEELGDKFTASSAASHMADIARVTGDREKAAACFDKAVELSRATRNKRLLADALHGKAWLNFDEAEFDAAAALNDEAYEIARDIQYQDSIFDSRVLRARLAAREDAAGAVATLEGMAAEAPTSAARAAALDAIYRITGDDGRRGAALAAWREAYAELPKAEYKKRIEELEG